MANEPDMKPMERHGLLMEIDRLNRMQTNLWESRRWQASVAAMQGIAADSNPDSITEADDIAEAAVNFADALIEQFRKTEAAK